MFPHKKCLEQHDPLLKGIDDVFYIPHSRHTTVWMEDVRRVQDLVVLSESEYTGLSIAKSKDNKKIFLTGHMEYDRDTLKKEYERDVARGLPVHPPYNYFTDDTFTSVRLTLVERGKPVLHQLAQLLRLSGYALPILIG